MGSMEIPYGTSKEKPLFYKKKIPDSFMLDNSIIISVKTVNVYSVQYASTLLKLQRVSHLLLPEARLGRYELASVVLRGPRRCLFLSWSKIL